MGRINGAAGEGWLKAACLITSVVLHAGLGTIGWQGFGTALSDSGPIMVALAEHPAVEAAAPASKPSGSLPGHVRSASAAAGSRRTSPPPAAPAANLQSSEPVAVATSCAIPETTIVEGLPAEGAVRSETAMGDGLPAAGDGAGNGAAIGLGMGSAGVEGGSQGLSPGGITLAVPRYALNPKPEYPRLARQNRWEGVVQLRATISASGEVEAVAVENSSGHQVLDVSALGGVRRWRFIPARRGDTLVPCEVRIPVAFKLNR